jgi:NYN domain
MLAYAIDNPAPTTIVLISGDRDFAYALSILRFRRYRIVLITLSNAHQSLRAQAAISFDWVSEILEPVDLTLSNRPTSPRRGKIWSPPAHDKFYSDSMGHNPSSSLFQDPYDMKSTNSVEFMNNFRDETRCADSENSRTPSKHDTKHDSLPPYLERQLAVSSTALNNGPETSARVVHSPVASSHTYPNGSNQTSLGTTACSSESNFSLRPTLTQTRSSQALQNSRLTETPCRLDLLCENTPLNHESSRLSHQQGSTSPINATQRLSIVDRMAIDDNHSGSPPAQSAPANVTAKATALTPSVKPSTSTLSTVSGITQISTNPLQPTPFQLVVPDKFKILVQCLKSHRSKGSLRPLRSIIAVEIACNGTTYRQAGVLKFGQYAAMAEQAGIVEMGGSEATAWIGLKTPWYNAPLS